jgi:uncharacterized protein YndB with AHSA1/START domain
MNLDRIERTMTLEVPRDEVWAAITEPDRISKWFGKETELDLRPGGHGVFRWENMDDVRVVVEEVDPPRKFSYRWTPSHTPADAPKTLVEFVLEEVPEGTVLRLVESGFAALPPKAREGNDQGWDAELGELQEYLATRVGA